MCICVRLEVRGPAFRHVEKACYETIKLNPHPSCIADCNKLETDTPYYAVCILCYETTHEKISVPITAKEQTVQPPNDNAGEQLAAKLKRAAKRAL
jgi:hypothetical protein